MHLTLWNILLFFMLKRIKASDWKKLYLPSDQCFLAIDGNILSFLFLRYVQKQNPHLTKILSLNQSYDILLEKFAD